MLWLLYIAAFLLFLLMLGNFFTYVIQGAFIFRPEKLPPDYVFSFQQPFDELWFDAPGNGRLNALWFRQEETTEGRKVVLFFHGNASSLKRWGHLYYFFGKYGYDYCTFDYRGFGKSRGRRSERLMLEDVEIIYGYLRQHYEPENIVIFGRSLGSTFATHLAAKVPCKALVLETPFFSMRDLYFAYFPFMPNIFRFRYYFRNLPTLKQVEAPVCILQGDKDLVVPVSEAEKLKSALKPGDRFVRIEGGSHNNLMFYDAYAAALEDILD